MIQLDQVTLRLGGRVILENLSLCLQERRIGVIGANGSGKSSFVRLLNGLLLPSEGQVLVAGLDTRRDGAMVRRRVGFLFQDPEAQIIMPMVADDVAFGLKGRGLTAAAIAARVADALAEQGLSGFADRSAYQLSGGEKQMLAIASVLVLSPDILVMDEPTTLLDLRNRRRLARQVARWPQQVIAVTHDFEFLDGFDRVLVIDKGRVVADDAPGRAILTYRALMLADEGDGRAG